MKNIKKVVLTVFVLFNLIVVTIPIKAVTPQVSISVSGNRTPGSILEVTINFSASENSSYEAFISLDNLSLVNEGNICNGTHCIASANTSTTFTVKAGNTSGAVYVSGTGVGLRSFDEFEFSAGANISISTPESGNSGTSGNSNNEGARPPHSGNQIEEEKEAIKTETPEEKEERLEKLKKEEEEQKKEELEAAKKVPLVSSINVISDSDKLKGEVLTEIKTEADKFDYEYTLPRRVDAFKLDLKSDATLDYVKDHKFAEGENEKKIAVKAKNEDFDQTINVVIKRNVDKFVERKVGDKSLAVYDDELLDKLMADKGFERKTFKDGDVEIAFFSKGKVNIQLLVDDKNQAQWYLLNDKNQPVEPLAMYLGKDGAVLFILEAKEEMRKETLHGKKYETKSRDLGKEFANIDKELKIENKYGAWEFAEGEIVWAMNENLEEDLYHISNDGKIKAAVVAFDQVDEKMKTVAIGTSVGLVGLIASNIVYFVLQHQKKKEIL